MHETEQKKIYIITKTGRTCHTKYTSVWQTFNGISGNSHLEWKKKNIELFPIIELTELWPTISYKG